MCVVKETRCEGSNCSGSSNLGYLILVYKDENNRVCYEHAYGCCNK
jgi:hypothetical protein